MHFARIPLLAMEVDLREEELWRLSVYISNDRLVSEDCSLKTVCGPTRSWIDICTNDAGRDCLNEYR